MGNSPMMRAPAGRAAASLLIYRASGRKTGSHPRIKCGAGFFLDAL
jgi:hypothetical protein